MLEDSLASRTIRARNRDQVWPATISKTRMGTMRKEAGDALAYYRAIKELFDPQYIMNPGKKWEDPSRPGG